MVSETKEFIDALQKLGLELSKEQLSKLESSPSKITWIKSRLHNMFEEIPIVLDSSLGEWSWGHDTQFTSVSPTPTEYATATESMSASSQGLGPHTPSKPVPAPLQSHTPLNLPFVKASFATLPARPIVLILEFLVDFRRRADPSDGCRVEAEALLAMTWMCRNIRMIALNHPVLWGQILRVDTDSLTWFTMLLKRSEGGPICLCTYTLDQILPLSPERERVWELAIENASRCIHLAYDDTKAKDHLPLQRLLQCRFPTLKHLSRFRGMETAIRTNKFTPLSMLVRNPSASESQSSSHSTKRVLYRPSVNLEEVDQEGVLNAPTLQTVRLFGHCGAFPVEEPHWPNITSFELHGISFNGKHLGGWTFHRLRYMLDHLSRLEELSIVGSILVPGLITTNHCGTCSSAIKLPNLRFLTLSIHFSLLNEFLTCLDIPKSSSINIQCFTSPLPLWINKERRRLDLAYAHEAISGVLKLFPTDIDYTTARIELRRSRMSYSLAAERSRRYSFTMGATECSTLTIEEIRTFFGESLRAFQQQFAPFAVEHLVLGCDISSERELADSLRSVLVTMPRLTSIRSDRETLESILTLSGIAVERCGTGVLMFPNVTRLYADHHLVDSLTTWSSLCFYIVWRTERGLSPIAQVIIDTTHAYDLEGLMGRCRTMVEKLPRFFDSLEIQLVSADVVHMTYIV